MARPGILWFVLDDASSERLKQAAPHITLSTATGIKPFASVAMLKNEHNETPLEPMTLTGTVQFEYLDQVKD